MCCNEKPGAANVVRSRTCSDPILLILYACAWAFLIVLMLRAQDEGASFDRATTGSDMQGIPCGTGLNGNRKYSAFPNPAYIRTTICVSDCAETNSAANLHMAVNYKSIAVAGYCLPDIRVLPANLTSAFNDEFSGAQAAVTRSTSDLWTLRYVLLASTGAALLVSIFVIMLSRHCVSCFVWSTIIFFLGGGVVLGGVFWYRYKDNGDFFVSEWTDAWFALAIASWSVTFICLLILIFLRKQLKIAIEVVREASRVISDMKCLICYPLLPGLFIVGYFLLFVLITLWFYSVGSYRAESVPLAVRTYGFPNADINRVGSANANPSTQQTFVTSETFMWWGIYNVFHMLWTIQTVYYVGYLTMAGAVAQWYFAVREVDGSKRRGEEDDQLSTSPILRSCCRTLFCHLGTAAFAGLIMAIIKTLRAVLAYVRSKIYRTENCFAKAMTCICACCLKCLDCCMDKVSKIALIWTAIFGDGFCTAACSSFALVLQHLGKVAAVNAVSTYIIFLCKLTVALVITAGCGIFIRYYDNLYNEVLSITVPLIILFIAAFAIASIVLQVFETTIDTIFFCFLIDLEYNQGQGKELRACQELVTIINGHAEESQEAFEKSGLGYSKAKSAKVAPGNGNEGDTANNTHGDVVEYEM